MSRTAIRIATGSQRFQIARFESQGQNPLESLTWPYFQGQKKHGNGNVQAKVRANNSGQFEGTAHENAGFRGKQGQKVHPNFAPNITMEFHYHAFFFPDISIPQLTLEEGRARRIWGWGDLGGRCPSPHTIWRVGLRSRPPFTGVLRGPGLKVPPRSAFWAILGTCPGVPRRAFWHFFGLKKRPKMGS